MEVDGPLYKSNVVNNDLVSLERGLSLLSGHWTIDSVGLYQGIKRTTNDVLNGLIAKRYWMADVSFDSLCRELGFHTECLAKYVYLQWIFFFSNYIKVEIAKAKYSSTDFESVEVLQRNDSCWIDDMGILSKVLYEKNCFSSLSHLEHKLILTDKCRPEACCFPGSFYSLNGLHQISVMYIWMVLYRNQSYVSARTTMAHEYVEMKNTPAVDSYGRMLDRNFCDYHAWYEMQEALDMMNMLLFALCYFIKWETLLPKNSRLPIAMAHCCYRTKHLSMFKEAIKWYKRAADCKDTEAITLHPLGKLHSELEGPNVVGSFCFRAHNYNKEAESHRARVIEYTGSDTSAAKGSTEENKSSKLAKFKTSIFSGGANKRRDSLVMAQGPVPLFPQINQVYGHEVVLFSKTFGRKEASLFYTQTGVSDVVRYENWQYAKILASNTNGWVLMEAEDVENWDGGRLLFYINVLSGTRRDLALPEPFPNQKENERWHACFLGSPLTPEANLTVLLRNCQVDDWEYTIVYRRRGSQAGYQRWVLLRNDRQRVSGLMIERQYILWVKNRSSLEIFNTDTGELSLIELEEFEADARPTSVIRHEGTLYIAKYGADGGFLVIARITLAMHLEYEFAQPILTTYPMRLLCLDNREGTSEWADDQSFLYKTVSRFEIHVEACRLDEGEYLWTPKFRHMEVPFLGTSGQFWCKQLWM